jgi:hypothetical protein
LAYFFWSRERKSKISELRTIERWWRTWVHLMGPVMRTSY